ncbi:indolepyruvate oxidoreductase subunit beta family protein [Paraburkholderia diazotrophica]|uniref:Indolepyruvate ferredoxin oxidoreductase beta subunit n=1 Tax=Paraburkholderia diazotrophica TaxID=667676 RepID=A0A1H7CJ43_9BURK|nr:indolepyruvate oxidoreductase subunit beta family protein [Paraburkholderia diazotrophica]SEJ88617.1 indolepyruvate ferredoxin oxidoreductase beta subunit [Paraburkholderia diazotrophica]
MEHAQPIKIAILAMGGEGGGVLADWIVDLGEHNSYHAQTTSVPGVAQRTGATIYYVELFPQRLGEASSRMPVLALMPTPGDVDIVLASELMEAGRAVQRGLVTQDRTTLIASTHRVYSIGEKSAMGDGRVDDHVLIAHAERAARRFVRFDMLRMADQTGSVISAVLFGALGGVGALPFSRRQFEETIERGGVGVKASLRAFDDAYGRVIAHADSALAANGERGDPASDQDSEPRGPVTDISPSRSVDPVVKCLLERVHTELPNEAHALTREGVRRLVDYQGPAYAALYLDRLVRLRTALVANSSATTVEATTLLRETARHLALWMSFEDTIRVADLKTRESRFARVRSEVGAQQNQVLQINEFLHPRTEEICDTLPAPVGRWLERSRWAHRTVARLTDRGRIVSTSSLRGFLLLYFVARLRVIRRFTLRYAVENARIDDWLAQVIALVAERPALAIEVTRCQRLIKGYGNTYARGLHNYQTVMTALARSGGQLAPMTLRELRDAALEDEHGEALRDALRRHSLN